MNELEQPKRGPGRPPKYHEVVAQTTEAPVVQTEPVKVRPSRKPFGTMEQKLHYPPRENYHRHWFNDVGDRINRALEAGYDHVKDRDGKNVSKIVGSAEGGGPMNGYLMEIPEEWFREDMKAQQDRVDEMEKSIKRGEFESKEGDGRYIPKQGISIKHGQ